MKHPPYRSNQRGISLVEAIVAGIATTIIITASVGAISFSGKGTQRITTSQQLQHESAFLGDLFARTVRQGSVVCANTEETPPTATIPNLSSVTIRAPKTNAVIATFGTTGGKFDKNGTSIHVYENTMIAPFPASQFRVFQNGKEVEITLLLIGDIAGGAPDSIRYTGTVRCKN